MIFDGKKYFPNSCVVFVNFKSFELGQMFAYLREREEILQTDLKKHPEDLRIARELAKRYPEAMKAFAKTMLLDATEKSLIWMATNCTGAKKLRKARRLEVL